MNVQTRILCSCIDPLASKHDCVALSQAMLAVKRCFESGNACSQTMLAVKRAKAKLTGQKFMDQAMIF
jgi:hypothetical protein